MKKKITRILHSFISLVRMQAFMTLMSLPILIAWGLPISALSVVGNVIFSPFLTVFLALCTSIFLCELVHIPTGPLMWALKITSDMWLWILSLPSNQWLISFAKPHAIVLLMLPVCALIMLHYTRWCSLYTSTLLFIALLLGVLIGMKIFSGTLQEIEQLRCNNGYVILVYTPQHTILIDPGYMGQRKSTPSWIEYTLIPHIIKKTGKAKLDYMVCLQPNKVLYESIELLAHILSVKCIYLPCYINNVDCSTWTTFMRFKKNINPSTKIIRLNKTPLTLHSSNNTIITITPSQEIIKKQAISYHAYTVQAHMAHQKVFVHSASSSLCRKKQNVDHAFFPFYPTLIPPSSCKLSNQH